MSPKELVFHLCITQTIILVLGSISGIILLGKSFYIDLLAPANLNMIMLGAGLGFMVASLDVVMMKFLPSRYYDDGGINEKLFTGMPAWQIGCLALFIAISEELLFRGVIQTQFGLVAASLIFAIIHMRYWNNWFLIVNVILLSFLIGWLFKMTGGQLLPVIAMHFTIDFLLGLHISRAQSDTKEKEGV